MKKAYPEFRLIGLAIILLGSVQLFGQQCILKGRLVTNDGNAAADVNVIIKEIKRGAISADDGSFKFTNVPAGLYTLIISSIGLQTVQKSLYCGPNQVCELNFTLHENQNELREVTVTGSKGLNEKIITAGKIPIDPMDLPQSITVIGRSILERQQTLRLSDALMNVNGVYVYGTTGGGQEEIGGRGYAFNSSNTFKNGARFNNGVMPEISGMEKVEVMKGS